MTNIATVADTGARPQAAVGGAGPGPSRHVELGRALDLAAALSAVLEGLDPAVHAPEGVAVLPISAVPAGARVVPHALAAGDGLALVSLARERGGSGNGRGLTGSRAAALAAVRLGVLSRMLELADGRLAGRRFGGNRLIDLELVIGAMADVLAELELSAAIHVDDRTVAEVAAAQHERLTEAGWAVARFFGAEGYLAGHPVRKLYVSALIADVWVPRAPDTEAGR